MPSESEDIWRRRTDEELIEAGAQLADYTESGESIIRAELRRRGLADPPPTLRPAGVITRHSDHPRRSIWGLIIGGITLLGGFASVSDLFESASHVRGAFPGAPAANPLNLSVYGDEYATACASIAAGAALCIASVRSQLGFGRALAIWVLGGLGGMGLFWTLFFFLALIRLSSGAVLGFPGLFLFGSLVVTVAIFWILRRTVQATPGQAANRFQDRPT